MYLYEDITKLVGTSLFDKERTPTLPNIYEHKLPFLSELLDIET